MENKVDRRVLRTQQALHETLIDLIAEKGYDSLTVEEIAERANVGRTTFYLHYQDKDDLLLDVTGDVADQLEEQFLALSSFKGLNIGDIVAMMFQLAGENVDMYRLIMNGQCGPQVLAQFQHKLTNLFQHVLEAREDVAYECTMPAGFIAFYVFGALQSTLVWWLDNDKPYTSEAMTCMFYELSRLGMGELFGQMQLVG